MTPIRTAFICSKACDIIAEDAFSVSSQHSIGLIDIKRGTFMRHRADMSLDMLEKCQLVPVRIPSLFEQNVLKAVSRTQLDRSCKVYAGKVESCTLASKKWGALEALFADCSYSSSIYLFQSM